MKSTKNELPNWVVSDMRFPNEFDGIKKFGGFTVRINRGETIPHDPALHPSETSLDSHEFDYVIDNNGTLEDLEMEVAKMLNHFKLI